MTMIRRLLILLLLAVSANATTRYVSHGGDNSDGSTWAKAFTSLNHLNAHMTVGDTAKFGVGKWFADRTTHETAIFIPTGGDASHVTVWSDSTWAASGGVITNYGEDTWNTAIIYGGDSITSWTQVGSTNVWYASRSITSDCWGSDVGWYALTQDDSMLIPLTNGSAVTVEGRLAFASTENRIYAWLWGNANPNNCEMIGACKPVVEFNSNQSYCKFYGLTLRVGKGGVVHWMGGATPCSYNLFWHCNLSVCGRDDGDNAAVVQGENRGVWSSYNGFVACDLSWAYNANQGGIGNAAACIYGMNHLRFDSCTFHHVRQGVYWKNDGPTDAPHAVGNVVSNSIFDGDVDNNESREGFTGTGGYGIWGAGNGYCDSIYGNIFKDISDLSIYAVYLLDYGRWFICNNTFYHTTQPMFKGSYSPDSTSIFKYNVVYDVTSGYFPLDLGDGVTISMEIDSNAYYDPTSSFGARGCGSTGTRTWSDWRSTCGYDLNSYNSLFGFNTTTYALPDTTDLTMNRTYGGQTWTRWGALQEETPCVVSHSLSYDALGQTSVTAIDTYSYDTDSTLTELKLIWDDDNNIAAPIDSAMKISGFGSPDSIGITGLSAGTPYYYWFVLDVGGCALDTSSVGTFTTASAGGSTGSYLKWRK